MRQKRKKGRPPKYVRDLNGKPVVGLSYDKSNNIHFNTHFKTEGVPKENFGNDLAEAVYLFRQWEAKTKGEDYQSIEKERVRKSIKVTLDGKVFKQPKETKEGYKKRITEYNKRIKKGEIKTKVGQLYKVPNSYIYAKARELILSDINKARKELNLPIKLDGTYRTDKSITLEEIGIIYFEKREKKLSPRHEANTKVYWSEFKDVVKVKMVSQLTPRLIQKYEDWVKAQSKKRNWEGATINNRLFAISTIFNQAYKHRHVKASDKAYINDARLLCTFHHAGRSEFDPKPISRDDFLKIYEAADVIYRCVMLCALNFGMKEAELVDIRLKNRKGRKNADIDIKNKTLAKPRTKTGIIGVAIVWDRTIDAINEMLKVTQNNSEFLFRNTAGEVMKARNINKWWQRIRKKVGVDDSVKFEHIRDAAQTVPIDHDPTLLFETKLLLGHSISGVTNNYLHRRPNMTKRVCAILEEHYFG